MEETVRVILTTQAKLQSAVAKLCRVSGRQERQPQDALTKQMLDDDVKTYIAWFESLSATFCCGCREVQYGQVCHPCSVWT